MGLWLAFLFWGIAIVGGLLYLPILSRCLSSSNPSPNSDSTQPLSWALSFPMAQIVFLFLFSSLGRLGASHEFILSFFLLVTVGVCGYCLKGTPLVSFFKNWKTQLLIPMVLFTGLFVLLLLIRARVPAIEYNPGAMGGEKLFNLALLQSFKTNTGYPPEFLWFSSEPTQYYLLPKALPGMVIYFVDLWFPGALSAQWIFHIADVFFVASGILALFGGAWLFLSHLKISPRVWLSLWVSLIPLAHFPFRALAHAVRGGEQFWNLSRIVDNTVNEYPFWNFVWGDFHAHSSVIAFNIFFVSLFVWHSQLLIKNSKLSILLGVTASVILMSHTFSVLTVGAMVGGISAYFFFRSPKDWKVQSLTPTACMVVVAVVASLPEWLTRQSPHVKYYRVPPHLSTSVAQFGNLYFSSVVILLFLVMLLLGKVLYKGISWNREGFGKQVSIWFAAVPWWIGGYWTVGLVIWVGCSLFYLVELFLKPKSSENSLLDEGLIHRCRSFILGMGMVLILPEILAMNFDMGEAYMRYNTLFRFLFDSLYFFPLLMMALLGVLWPLLKSNKARRFLAVGLASAVCISLWVQFHSMTLREGTFKWEVPNGFAFLGNRDPLDWELLLQVEKLSSSDVLGELCGLHGEEGAYTQRGRLSAYAGKKSLCGWIGHAGQFHITKTRSPDAGKGGYQILLQRAQALDTVYRVASDSSSTGTDQTRLAFLTLKEQGMTHLALGEVERKKYPSLTPQSMKTHFPNDLTPIWIHSSQGAALFKFEPQNSDR